MFNLSNDCVWVFGLAFSDEETGCSVGNYTVSSRRRWNYENNCAAIVCYVSTGLASSSTQLTDLSEDIIQRHQQLAKSLRVENVIEVLTYVVNKLLRSKSAPTVVEKQSTSNNTSAEIRLPAIHLKVFYQVRWALLLTPSNILSQYIKTFLWSVQHHQSTCWYEPLQNTGIILAKKFQ